MEDKNTNRNFLNEYLQSIEGMQDAEPNPFFYTRLQAAMKKEPGWQFPLKPAWIISGLAFLLLVNTFIITHRFTKSEQQPSIESNSLQGFAEAYDLSIHSTY
ncbi:MAG: hypothetical protein QM726_01225 [Chitinophagaceae bacterium]